MKSKYTIPAIALLMIFLAACSDDEPVKVQNYDSNEMIAIMNTMSGEIDSMKMRGDVERDFAKLMIVHHQGAIDMGMKQIKKGDDPELKVWAKTMIDIQQSEMDKMYIFLVDHHYNDSPDGYQWDAEAQASITRMNNATALHTKIQDADNDFAALLIQHHYAASDLAQSFLQYSDNSELVELAEKMIEDQSNRIEELQNWLLQNRPRQQN